MVLISATLMPSLSCRKKMIAGSMSPEGTHHQAFQRVRGHGGVDGLAVLDGADGAAVAQVAVDDAELFHRLVQLLGRFQADVVVAGAVAPPAATDAVLFVELVRQGVRKASSGMVWWKAVSNTATFFSASSGKTFRAARIPIRVSGLCSGA